MLAMQYRFVFPADYDMSIIRRRIAERGAQLDGYPDMCWKSYLWTERRAGDFHSENSYAPFYLWQNNDGINRFLSSAGFKNLCRDFGRPQIDLWSVLDYLSVSEMRSATCLVRQVDDIATGKDMSEFHREATDFSKAMMEKGALSVVTGFDPYRWRSLRVTTWATAPEPSVTGERGECYPIGYVALGADARLGDIVQPG